MAAPSRCSSSVVTLFLIGLLLGFSFLVTFTPQFFSDYRVVHHHRHHHHNVDDFILSLSSSPSSSSLMVLMNQTSIRNSTSISVDHHLYNNNNNNLSAPAPAPAPALSHGRNFSTASREKKKKKLQNSTMVIRRRSSLDKIEGELATARAAIRKAVLSQNYTSSYKHEGFVPRGSVYRNPAAFHQSHTEMVKRFKVWTYTEGEPPLFHDGPVNDIYGIEGQFIDEMSLSRRKSPFRANHPGEAHAFFIPFSVAKVIHFVYKPIISVEGFSRHRLHQIFEDYVAVVASKYPYWNRSRGGDHFMMSCHDWAPDVIDGNPKLFENFIRGLCNANTSEGFRPKVDVSIPEINIPKGKLSLPINMKRPQPPSGRSILAFFAGRAHGRIRKVLFKYWKEKDDVDVQVYESLPPDKDYMNLMGQSRFCLCPSGWEVASPREVEAINAGCVPVIISDNYSLPFNDVLDWDKFSVQIPVTKIPEIKTILQSVSRRRYLMMYKRVIEVKRHFVLNRPAQPYDVMHMMLHSVWLRRLNLRLVT